MLKAHRCLFIDQTCWVQGEVVLLQGVPQGAHVTTISSGVREVASPQGLEVGVSTPPTVVLGPTTSWVQLGPTPRLPMATCNNSRLTKLNRSHLVAAGEALVSLVLYKPQLSSMNSQIRLQELEVIPIPHTSLSNPIVQRLNFPS